MDNHFHLVLDATRADLVGMQLADGRHATYFYGRRGQLFGHRWRARVVGGNPYHEAACRDVAWTRSRAALCERPASGCGLVPIRFEE